MPQELEDLGVSFVLQMGFACDVCRRNFLRKADLERHMLTHTGDRPHTCPHCNFACNRSSNLYRHIRSTHPSFMVLHPSHIDPTIGPPLPTPGHRHLQSS
ncbi:hypothetical protein Pcinc_014481 [Petrolisthes cinctipes]|uniref:C2H2-type domain-containing protein n=1 Tax=Petrolisthes cinctipes TaxID=88211 RepID=A0AAE1FUX1_PETCI|nr:hypothetical protein Pcinc_014481 [Petrolisthes cinctipes]